MLYDLKSLAALYNSGKNTAEIAQLIGESVGTVYKLLEQALKQDIPVEQPRKTLLEKSNDKRKAYQYLRKKGRSVRNIAALFNVTPKRITASLLSYSPQSLRPSGAIYRFRREPESSILEMREQNALVKDFLQRNVYKDPLSAKYNRPQEESKRIRKQNYQTAVELYKDDLPRKEILRNFSTGLGYNPHYILKEANKEVIKLRKISDSQYQESGTKISSRLSPYSKIAMNLNAQPGTSDKKALILYNYGMDVKRIASLTGEKPDAVDQHIKNSGKKGHWISSKEKTLFLKKTVEKISSNKIDFESSRLLIEGKENFYDIFLLKERQPDLTWDQAIKHIATENNQFLEAMFRACTIEYINQPTPDLSQDPILVGGRILQEKLGWLF